ncbi:homeobox protein transcription factor [Anaeramoeba flamelloides]|uniref:Homeobox protein transcription factor n=1 Tax=Anaeramoeba flamelloides TaxID=1746091 RepID=A0AAV7Z3U7_9EUKA|nr:homeobox protein transcription factor [Anaeramoeba flamelloides]
MNTHLQLPIFSDSLNYSNEFSLLFTDLDFDEYTFSQDLFELSEITLYDNPILRNTVLQNDKITEIINKLFQKKIEEEIQILKNNPQIAKTKKQKNSLRIDVNFDTEKQKESGKLHELGKESLNNECELLKNTNLNLIKISLFSNKLLEGVKHKENTDNRKRHYEENKYCKKKSFKRKKEIVLKKPQKITSNKPNDQKNNSKTGSNQEISNTKILGMFKEISNNFGFEYRLSIKALRHNYLNQRKQIMDKLRIVVNQINLAHNNAKNNLDLNLTIVISFLINQTRNTFKQLLNNLDMKVCNLLNQIKEKSAPWGSENVIGVKRKRLSTLTKKKLLSWFNERVSTESGPYASYDQKLLLAKSTGVSVKQVTSFLGNQRRRTKERVLKGEIMRPQWM